MRDLSLLHTCIFIFCNKLYAFFLIPLTPRDPKQPGSLLCVALVLFLSRHQRKWSLYGLINLISANIVSWKRNLLEWREKAFVFDVIEWTYTLVYTGPPVICGFSEECKQSWHTFFKGCWNTNGVPWRFFTGLPDPSDKKCKLKIKALPKMFNFYEG